MEHLPVILKKSSPFLTTCSEATQRAVCPRGKLLCFLDNSGHLQVHSLHQQDQSVSVEGITFASFKWIVSTASGQDCVLDQTSQQRSDLLAVTSDLQLYWYSVCETQDDRLKTERLATMSKNDLYSELRKLNHSDSVDRLVTIGTHNGGVLLLVNSALLCTLTFDPEFSRLAIQSCLAIDPSTDQYADSSLPQWVGAVVNIEFISPLLFVLTQDGLIFVYNMTTSQCVGVVYPLVYCQYQCSRQADSEELLLSISSGTFKYVSVSPELTHLVAATEENNMVVINLPDYFQMFPNHYNPKFTRMYLKNQRSRVIAPVHQSTIEQEEDEDRLKYGGFTDKKQHSEPYLGIYVGYHGHLNQVQRLGGVVDKFQPSKSKTFNFHKASHFQGASVFESKRNRLLRIPGVKNAVSTLTAVEPLNSLRKPWFEEPLLHSGEAVLKSNFNVTFVTGISKSGPSSKQASLVSSLEDALAPSKYHYGNACLLPTPPISDGHLVNVEFSSDLIVCYYGNEIGKKEAEKSPIVGGAQVMVSTLVIYHTDKQMYSLQRLTQSCWLVQSSSSDRLLYLINSHMLAVTTFNLSQEEFIGKVLMYGSATVAEELCHLNRWDKCSLPVNALETALELRQLDTLAFFLRTRDSGSIEGEESAQQQTEVATPTLPPLPPEQLDTVVQLLIGAIKCNYVEEQNCQFASQLLLMTLGFLTRIIKTQVLLEEQVDSARGGRGETDQTSESGGDDVSLSDPAAGVSVSLTDLTSYIEQLRAYLPKMDKAPVGGVRSGASVGPMAFVDRGLVKAWDKMSTKEVIKDALLKSSLPLAQTYLVHTRTTDSDKMGGRGFGLSEAIEDQTAGEESRYNGSLNNITTVATGFIMEALDRWDLTTATSLLVQMGMNVKSCLKHICFNTVSRTLRDFLAEELMSRSWLEAMEIQTLDYLHTLERFYPIQSYDHAHSLYSKQHPRKMTFQATALPMMPGIVSRPTAIPTVGNLQDVYPENFGGDYSLSRDSSSSHTPYASDHTYPPDDSVPPYLQVSLASVLEWDTPTKERVLFEGMVLCAQTDGNGVENKDHVFHYHVSRSDVTSVVRFVMSSVPPLENHTPCPAHIVELCSRIPHSTGYLQSCLRNELARHGVFMPDELQDLPRLLYRLGQIHSLFTHPHPLTKVTEEETCEESGVVVSIESFHSTFLKYLIENRFYSLMYHYLGQYHLGFDDESISVLGLDKAEEPWVEVLLQYRRAAAQPNDPDMIFQASLSCSHLLLSSGGGGHMTVMGMLSNGRTLMAMATLMFAPVPLEEAMSASNSHQPWYVDPVQLRRAVSAYPSLKAALFPSPPTALSPAHSQDISVYQLLQGSVPFNISRLFKWQSTNKSGHEESTSVELPHFSYPALTDKFAFTEHLNYVYYLRRGQPSFAFANFMAAKLIGHSNTAKRLDKVASRVYRLTMLDFSNSRLVSSCVAFIEMCGRDSTLLRVDSQAALRMARHCRDPSATDTLKEEKDGEAGRHQKIAAQFVQLYRSPDNSSMAAALLSQLETSTHHMITSGGVELHGLEAEDCWILVQNFCQCHQLPPSLGFITVCAKEGQWLPLLCHSQLFSIPPHKVLIIVDKHFSDLSLREHLHLAVSSMVTRGAASSPGHGGHERSRYKRKRVSSLTKDRENLVAARPDLRAKFYSRVGLQRGAAALTDSRPAEDGGPEQPSTEKQDSGSTQQTTPPTSPPVPEPEPHVPIEECDLPGDLFSALLKCQADKTPWRSLLAHAIALERPLLAILAACYEHSSMVACLCVWLYCTLGHKVMVEATQLLGIATEEHQSIKFCADLQWREWTSHDLSLLLVAAMQTTPTPVASFTLAFKYFGKSDACNPLLAWMKFQEEFVLRTNYPECSKCLNEFSLARNKVTVHNMELSIGDDVPWMDELTSTMAAHMLVKCPTPFERSHLLRLLSEANFGQDFKNSGNVLRYDELHQMSNILSEAGLASDVAFTVTEHFSCSPSHQSLSEVYSVQVEVHTERVLSLLLKLEKFGIARKYSSIVQCTASQISVNEAEHNLRKLARSSYFKYEQARLNFWNQCDAKFQAENVDPDLAAGFFETIVHDGIDESFSSAPSSREATPTDQTTPFSAAEYARLLAYALKWRKSSKTPLSDDKIREMETEIWRYHIKSTLEKMDTLSTSTHSSSPLPFLPEVQGTTDLSASLNIDQTSLLSSLSVTAEEEFKGRRRLTELLLSENVPVKIDGQGKSTLSEKEGRAFDVLLGRLLNAGLITQARELSELFHHNSPDLTIILSCIKLAQGLLTPDQLTQDVLSLISTRSPLSRHLSDASLSHENQQNRPSGEILHMMNRLSDRSLYSHHCISLITTAFRLAVLLRTPYAAIVSADPLDTLTKILSKSSGDKANLAMAGKFIQVCNLEPHLVSTYLADTISATLLGKGNGRDSPKVAAYHRHMSSRGFKQMISHVIKDYAQLGNDLLSRAKLLVSAETPSNEFSVPVELMIRAHDAFSLGSCVDGVADVLVLAQTWISKLMAGKQYQLMVRILTGLSRYNELGYIIGLLIEGDEFERLVHTGVENAEQLRVALLDYLRTHGNNQEKIQMVALKFGMFRELAKTKEDQAMNEIKNLKPKQLVSSNSDTVRKLKASFEGFKAASKTYAQEDILRKAEYCATQARLVALQLSLLQAKKQVVNLTARGVLQFMEEQPFSEALIVSEAYRHQIRADWVNTLYKRVICKGDFRYLADFKSAFSFSHSLVQELANRYTRDKERTFEMTSNLKKVLTQHLNNLPLRNKLCIQLGFKELSTTGTVFDESFLNDLSRL